MSVGGTFATSGRGLLPVGHKVQLACLNNHPNFNGLTGEVEGYDSASERYQIRGIDFGVKFIKVGNLVSLPRVCNGSESSGIRLGSYPEQGVLGSTLNTLKQGLMESVTEIRDEGLSAYICNACNDANVLCRGLVDSGGTRSCDSRPTLSTLFLLAILTWLSPLLLFSEFTATLLSWFSLVLSIAVLAGCVVSSRRGKASCLLLWLLGLVGVWANARYKPLGSPESVSHRSAGRNSDEERIGGAMLAEVVGVDEIEEVSMRDVAASRNLLRNGEAPQAVSPVKLYFPDRGEGVMIVGPSQSSIEGRSVPYDGTMFWMADPKDWWDPFEGMP